MPQHVVVGKSLPRIDAIEKVTGKAQFGGDLFRPRMLHAKILRSPHAHARILRIDTSRAARVPGVKGVVTARDFAHPEKQYGLAHTVVRFVGEGIAAVAAVDRETAEEALELISVEYEPLPAIFTPAEALQPNALLVVEMVDGTPLTSNVLYADTLTVGDIEAGFAEADLVIEHHYQGNAIHQGYIELHSCLAEATFDGKVTLWTSTQAQFRIRAGTAAALGVPMTAVRVFSLQIGGGFGGKSQPIHEPVCALLAQKTQRPIQLILTREEEFVAGRPRPACTIALKTGVKKDGTLVANQAKVIVDCGAVNTIPAGPVTMALNLGTGYNIPHVQNELLLIATHKRPYGAVRGLIAPELSFAWESQIDTLATALGIDPLEMRLINAWKGGDRTLAGVVIPEIGLREALVKAADRTGWRHRKARPGRGYGMAIGQKGGGAAASSAGIKVNEDGTVGILTGGVDISGAFTSIAQVVAEELGIAVEDVRIHTTDTDMAPPAQGSFGSLFTTSMGNAVQRATRELKAKLIDLAAEHLEANPQDLECMHKQVRVKGSPEKAVSFAELYTKALTHAQGALVVSSSAIPVRGGPPFAVHMVEVEVDPETKQVTVLRYVNAQDVGCALNRLSILGNIEGGIAQGLGSALSEDLLMHQGKTLNASFLDYKIPSALDVPPIETVLVESHAGGGPYGAMGVGESPMIPPPAALANAIYDAVGVRIRELPLTAEKIFLALQNHEQKT
jgi:CO/xanthine dehydrogenase Mo-binding subunit